MAPSQPEHISPCTARSCPGTRNSVPREQPTLYHTPLESSRQGPKDRQCAPRVPCQANRLGGRGPSARTRGHKELQKPSPHRTRTPQLRTSCFQPPSWAHEEEPNLDTTPPPASSLGWEESLQPWGNKCLCWDISFMSLWRMGCFLPTPPQDHMSIMHGPCIFWEKPLPTWPAPPAEHTSQESDHSGQGFGGP